MVLWLAVLDKNKNSYIIKITEHNNKMAVFLTEHPEIIAANIYDCKKDATEKIEEWENFYSAWRSYKEKSNEKY